jgi:hypothetical protein
VAGLIDSMAGFSMKKSVLPRHIAWQCKLIVLTTDIRKINFFDEVFQVSRSIDKSHNFEDLPDTWEGRKAQKKLIGWTAGGAFLDYVVSIIDPYVVFNRDKLELVKQFRSTFKGLGPNRVSEDTQYEREIIMKEFHKLQRGITQGKTDSLG